MIDTHGGGDAMTEYKFDGKTLRDRHLNRLGLLDGTKIRDAHSKLLGTIDGNNFRDAHGSKIAVFDGKLIRDSHGTRIGTIDEIKKTIEGIGGASLVAMWFFFVR